MLLELSRTLVVSTPASRVGIVNTAYSSVLLLDGCFDASLTDDPLFSRACESGFGWYFESMWHEDELGNEVFKSRLYTRSGLLNVVRRNAMPDKRLDTELAWRAGFTLGWLSALALVQGDALVGLELLIALIAFQQCGQGVAA